MPNKILRDSVLTGVFVGMLSIILDYILLYNLDRLISYLSGHDILLKEPKLQLLILAVNIILFRFFVVKWKKIETGKGVLLAIIVTAAWYISTHKMFI
jgi:hypothetical protein